MAAVHLAGWPSDVVEVALGLLAYCSHGGEGLPSWCHERMFAWYWRNSLELLLLLDYLIVPVDLLHMILEHLCLVIWRNGLAAAVHPAADCLASLPQQLQLPFARSVHPDLWFELMTSPSIIQRQLHSSGLSDDVSVWQESYKRFLAAAVQWARREDSFRCYGPITGRDLSMRPPSLQGWYQDFSQLEGLEDSSPVNDWHPAWMPQAVDELSVFQVWARALRKYVQLPFSSPLRIKPASQVVTTQHRPSAAGGSSSETQEPSSAAGAPALTISTKSIELLGATSSVTPKRSNSRVERGSPSRIFLAPVASAAAVPVRSASEQGLGLSVLGFRMASPLPPIQPPAASPIHTRKQAVAVPSYRSSARARPAKPLSKAPVDAELLQGKRSAAAVAIQRIVRGALDRAYVASVQLMQIASHYPSGMPCLATPSLFGCEHYINTVIEDLSRTAVPTACPTLDVRGCCGMSPSSILIVSNTWKSLTWLDLSFCSLCGDEELLHLTKLAHLQTLQLIGWDRLTSDGLIRFATSLEVNTSRPAIEKDNAVAFAPVFRPRVAVCFTSCIRSCTAALNLADCTGLTSAGVSRAFDALPGIVDVCLFGCLQLTDTALLGLGRTDCRIQWLNTGGVYKITTAGVQYLFTQHPTLKLYSNPNEFNSWFPFVDMLPPAS